jgi:4-hydroxybutyryl-CoA dehydratase/vinylacetyl-CoA-Delta-isomerase
MGLRTVEQYQESIRDGRVVYISGQKVDDVTKNALLRMGIETSSIDYAMAEMPEYREISVVMDEEIGEPSSRYYYTPKNADDLLKRHELMVTGTRLGQGHVPFSKDIASDALNAVKITARAMGKPEYMERARRFRQYLSMAGAVTCVKGDRSIRPSDPRQEHPDFYVRVVDRNSEGIVVRGAKAHITGAAYYNEILVLPCRNMTEADKDYAVSFAVPANTKGLIQIPHPMHYRQGADDFPVDLPFRGHTDSLIIFEDVFVPWERVFMCGEWEYAMTLVYNFAYLHRHTAASYHIPPYEAMLGMAQAIAEYNGIEKVAHVREKITDMIIFVNTLKSLARASCMDCVLHQGIPIPNPVITNIAKYHYANNYHAFAKALVDICGGLLSTAPTYRDWTNPEIGGFLKKYLIGKAGTSAEERLRMLQLIRNTLGVENDVRTLHAEGSLAAQRMTIYAESLEDLQAYKKQVKKYAGILKPEPNDFVIFDRPFSPS